MQPDREPSPLDHLHSTSLMGLQALIGAAAAPESQGLVLPPRPCPCGSTSALKQTQPQVSNEAMLQTNVTALPRA